MSAASRCKFYRYRRIAKSNIGLGAIVQTELQGGRRTYYLVIEENVNDVPKISVICATLELFEDNMVKKKVKRVSIAKNKDGLERLPCLPIKSAIQGYV